MPRAPEYTPTYDLPAPPDSFESLDELAAYSAAPHPPTPFAAAQIPYMASDSVGSKLLVCHDYKGGYTEKEKENARDYTFPWWHYCDTFIYFSHRRVAMPPPAWIRSAHRHGTKILGTLIFEWDAGKRDLDRLLGPEVSLVSTEVADSLVDLAVERGFEGWLVNVEVPLGIEGKASAEQHAQGLLVWLRYLRDETARRVPGGETIWYDGANVEGVRWQNRLSPLNSAFFAQADGIFLNYFWRGDHVKETMSRLGARSREDVYFGLDVWGRGQFGGGGFASWRALDLLHQTSNLLPAPLPLPFPSSTATSSTAAVPVPSSLGAAASPSPSDSNFSVALFAPAWSVESEHLGHSLVSRDGWSKWWQDELHLWTGSEAGPNVERERLRMEEERRVERGVQRAMELAAALSPRNISSIALSSFNYNDNAPLPPILGTPRPLASYRPAPRPPAPAPTFYTNFSQGSGHRFFLEGRRVIDSTSGWTEVDFAFPFPSLAIPTCDARVHASLTDEEAWMGAVALRIDSTAGEAQVVPIAPTSVRVAAGQHFTATLVYKPLAPFDEVKTVVNCDNTNSWTPTLGSSSSLNILDLETTALHDGWMRTSALVTSHTEHPAVISSLGVSCNSTAALATLLVGSLALTPSSRAGLPSPRVSNLRWGPQETSLRWDVRREVSGVVLASSDGRPSGHRGDVWPSFLFFSLWHRAINGEEVFLGTTAAREFAIERGRLGGGQVVCRGVLEDGSVDLQAAICNV